MYCYHCGVKLAETELSCPLCRTDLRKIRDELTATPALYPKGRRPVMEGRSAILNGSILVTFMIALLITFLIDLQGDRRLNWFGFVAGGLILAYVTCVLPLWFRKPNPIIFVPSDFAAAAAYLLYIDLRTYGGWFLPFALPVIGMMCLIVTAVVVLFKCVSGGRLYILGGAALALGGSVFLIEYLLAAAFSIPFTGWSFYPLSVMLLLGGFLIYLGIDRSARLVMERKFFI